MLFLFNFWRASLSFFRYPGGKSKLKNHIISKLKTIGLAGYEYREPFFGGGSIGLNLIDNLNQIWVNDFDLGISCLWTTLINHPDLLKKRVLEFKPSLEHFYQFKKDLTEISSLESSDIAIADFGFKKLAIHQISYSGLGTKSGGPLGGKKQQSKYKIDCRWSPNYICKKIDKLHKSFLKLKLRENSCTNKDFSELILDNSEKSLLYLDPPYFHKGNELYQFGFKYEDHQRLADNLRMTNHKWLLSYDDCPEIRSLYKWASIEEINEVSYTITALKDKDIDGKRLSRSKSELLITSKV